MPGPEVRVLLEMLDGAYNRKSWHGTNLRGSLRGLTYEQAAFRPSAARHNIWEIALHAAYWKYSVRRRLTGEPRSSFPLKGSNWFARPAPGNDSESAWKGDVALLDQIHRTLRAAIESLRPDRLETIPAGSTTTILKLVTGVAAHDLYHAGQIQLLKRLQAN
jgi:uncharacterized damage-inducible protein DinB